jgi:peptidyl-prolyl cis-trans isomerase SurA
MKKLIFLLKKLETESFKSLARKESDGPYAEIGGDLGWNTIESLPSLFAEKVKEMNINEVVITNSSNGTHILKLEDKKTKLNRTKRFVLEYKFQQILLKKTTLTSDNDQENKIKNIKNLVTNGLDFKEAIKKYSEDTTNKDLDELNWINIENLLPEYKKQFEAYPKENLIGPFKTQLGWHLIYIYDYQERDVTNESNKEIAKLELIRAKTELRFEDWFAVLIENSKIKIVEDN